MLKFKDLTQKNQLLLKGYSAISHSTNLVFYEDLLISDIIMGNICWFSVQLHTGKTMILTYRKSLHFEEFIGKIYS